MCLRTLLFLALIFSPRLFAQPLEISEGIARASIADHAQYLEDQSRSLSIDDVIAPDFNSRFINSTVEELHFGLTRSAYWIRFDLNWAEDALGLPWLLEIGPPKHVEGLARGGSDIYILDNNDHLLSSQRLGRYELDNELKTLESGYVVRLNPQTDQRIYLRIESARELRLPISLWQQNAYRSHEINATLWFGIEYGILIAMIFYNLFLYFSIRERSFLYYVLAIASQLAFLFLDSKHARFINESEWISPWLINMLERDIYVFMAVTTLQFHRNLLQLYSYNPMLDRISKGLIGLLLGSLALSLLNDEKIFQNTYLGLIIIVIVLVFYTNFDALQRGIRIAGIHLAASTLLLFGACIQLSYQIWHLLPANWFTTQAYNLALLAQVILLSFGLAFRYNALRKEKEEAQQLAIENLRKSDRIKDELLANVSHELRTPVHGINGLAEIALRSTTLPDENTITIVRKNLELISSSGARLIGLIDNLLDFSAARHDVLSLQPVAIDLHRLTTLVLALVKPMAIEKSVRVVNDVPVDLPAVSADENRLHQILLNLVFNAVKFTDSGEVCVSASSPNTDSVLICVTDSGRGISIQDQQIIFLPFERGGQMSEQSGGVGLGLAIASSLVAMHGSELKVRSELGAGSQFSFRLPISTSVATPPVANHHLINRSSYSSLEDQSSDIDPRTSTEAGALTILIVDDDTTNRILIRQQLSQYRVLEASNGRDAVNIVANTKPDLVLLDLMMPGMDGYETCKEIRNLYNQAELPVIIVTAKNHLEDLAQGFKTGANDFLSKPFYALELTSRVSSHLKLSELQRVNLDNVRLRDQLESYMKAAQEMRATKVQLQQWLDGMTIGFIAFTYPGIVIYLNQPAADLLGTSQEQLLTANLIDWLPDCDVNSALLNTISTWESGESTVGQSKSYDAVIRLSKSDIDFSEIKLKVHLSFLGDDDNSGILFFESGDFIANLQPQGVSNESGAPVISNNAQSSMFNEIEMLDLVHRNIRGLGARLKLLTPDELQEYPELMNKLVGINDIYNFLDAKLPASAQHEKYKEQLIALMQMTLHVWEATTHKSKIELAEDSRIWVVSVDDGRLRTRTFDRYLRLDLLPKIPRWREVIRTTYFVLSNPNVEPTMRVTLELELNKTKKMLQDAAIS